MTGDITFALPAEEPETDSVDEETGEHEVTIDVIAIVKETLREADEASVSEPEEQVQWGSLTEQVNDTLIPPTRDPSAGAPP